MDPDHYVKNGLFSYLKFPGVNVMVVSNLGDLTINLKNNHIHVVVMELFSRDDDVFHSIEFVRNFHVEWPEQHLIIYTQLKNENAICLLKAVTGVNDIFYKNEQMKKLANCISSSLKRRVNKLSLIGE